MEKAIQIITVIIVFIVSTPIPSTDFSILRIIWYTQQTYEVGTIISILQMEKQSHQETCPMSHG